VASPDIVVLVPVPVVVFPSGLLVNVQLPDEGKLFNTTLPVDTEHVGCVRVPTVGVNGVFTAKLADADPVTTGLEDTTRTR